MTCSKPIGEDFKAEVTINKQKRKKGESKIQQKRSFALKNLKGEEN